MLHIRPIPAFKNNYIWLLGHQHSDWVAVVDPGDAQPVLAYCRQYQKQLAAILITHHHRDHIGGIEALLEADCTVSGCPVYGPAHEAIPMRTHALQQGDCVALDFLGLNLSVLDIPGHTLGHIAYLGNNLLFCGDTLFSAGCGRLFEGTAEQLYHSLQQLAALPEQTLVFCTHEYTHSNVQFALHVDPENTPLAQFALHVEHCQEQGKPTLPASLAIEKQINPFLRCHSASIISAVQQHIQQPVSDPVAVFAALRQWKNNF